jgi:hypothetical protein
MKQGNNDCTHTLMQQAGLVYCVLWVQHMLWNAQLIAVSVLLCR